MQNQETSGNVALGPSDQDKRPTARQGCTKKKKKRLPE